MHAGICGPFDVNSFGKKRYFITFIDEYSRYDYIYLLPEKSQAMDALEIYLNEVERQLDRKVKVVRSDRGGEYYERYDETWQHPGPFAKLLQKHGICAQYIIFGTPQQKGISERRNRTIMDMVREYVKQFNFTRIFVDVCALKTIMYLLNKVPSKQFQRHLLNCGRIRHLV